MLDKLLGIGLAILSFGGQQYGKGAEWERQQIELQMAWQRQQVEKKYQDQIQLIKDLCKDQHICGPAVQYVMPAPNPALIGPPAPGGNE